MKKLSEKDRDAILKYTKQNPQVNLFIIGDLMHDGFDDTIQSFYGRYEEDALVNIVMRYRDESLHVYADALNTEDMTMIQAILDETNCPGVNFGSQTAPLLMPHMSEWGFDCLETKLTVYKPEHKQGAEQSSHANVDINIEQAQVADAPVLKAAMTAVFPDTVPRETVIAEQLATEARLTYIIREGNEIASFANAVAFTEDAGMIVGVGTLPKFRKKGYASAVVGQLCDTMLERGQRAVLFYESAEAASVYHKIGFVDQEKYIMAKRQINEN